MVLKRTVKSIVTVVNDNWENDEQIRVKMMMNV